MSSENKLATDADALRSRVNQVSNVSTQDVSFRNVNGSVQTTVQSKARKAAGVELQNPGGCPSYFFKDLDLLVFDLREYHPPQED